MQNRGNGKGGGIAAAGLVAEQLGISDEMLESHYLLQIALLDTDCHAELEREFILPHFDVALSVRQPHVDDYRDIPGLEVCPPDVHRYVVRVKPGVLRAFAEDAGLQDLEPRALEDEFVWRNSYRLNDAYYASLGEKRAFVLSHSRNLLIFKLVGYAEQNVEYYQLQDFKAHVWIAHQRYPTKGRVWHPGGAHPFVGLNEALVHNGDFANYHSVCEYLRQRNIRQQFLTDTEVSVQLFDLWDRVYEYPLEYIIEALAPTTEHDFDQLPPEKQLIYRQIQATHIHASPDGPWFFIIARSQGRPVPAAGHHRHGHAAPAGIRALRHRRGPDRPDLLGEAGHRRHAAQPGRGRQALLSGGRQLLERPRRLLHRRRRLHLHRGAGQQRPQRADAPLLHRQVRPRGQGRQGLRALRPAAGRDRRRLGRRLPRRHSERGRGPGEAAPGRRGRPLCGGARDRLLAGRPASPVLPGGARRGGRPQGHRGCHRAAHDASRPALPHRRQIPGHGHPGDRGDPRPALRQRAAIRRARHSLLAPDRLVHTGPAGAATSRGGAALHRRRGLPARG